MDKMEHFEEELTRIKEITENLSSQFYKEINQDLDDKKLCDYLVTVIETKRGQQSKIKSQIKQEDHLTKKLLQMKKDYQEMTDLNEKLIQEVEKTQQEVKHSKAPLKAAIKKYSENFGINMKIKENLNDKYITTVSVLENKNLSFDLHIDKNSFQILDVDFSSLPEQITEKFDKEAFLKDPNIYFAQLRLTHWTSPSDA